MHEQRRLLAEERSRLVASHAQLAESLAALERDKADSAAEKQQLSAKVLCSHMHACTLARTH